LSSLREQLARLFLEPEVVEAPAEREVRWVAPAPTAAAVVAARAGRVAVVCGPRDARVAGGAAGLALVLATCVRTAVVLDWTGAREAGGQARPAAPAAHGAAAMLRDGGLAARALGRLVRVALPEGECDAVSAARSALGNLAVPAVLVVAAPRGEAMEELLAGQERVLLVHRPGVDEEMAALALAEIARLGPAAVPVALAGSPGAAALARSGHALVSPLRAPFLEAVGAAPRRR
jgi:hypothetical protein